MADSHVLQGSSPVIMKKQLNSSELAESLSTIVQQQGTNITFQEGDFTGSLFVEDLVKRLRSTSSDSIVRQLVTEYPENLTRLRDNVLKTVRSKWTSSCPKGKLMRRITRSGGTTAPEKLGQDIVLLAKFYESGEVSNELTNIFHKNRNAELSHVAEQEADNISEHPSFKKLLEVVEDLKAKFVELDTQHKSEFYTVKEELNDVRSELAEKNARICRLEEELSSVRANCRASKEHLTAKFEGACVEIENTYKAVEKLFVKQKRSKTNIEQLRKVNLNKITAKTKNNSKVLPKGTNGTDKTTEKLQSNIAAVINNNEQGFDGIKTPVIDVDGEQSITIHVEPDANDVDSNNSNNSKPAINIKVNECQENNPEINTGACKKDMNLINSNLQVNKDDSSSEFVGVDSSSEFVGVERRRTKRIYLGGVKDCVKSETIKHFMEEKGIYPTFIRTMKSKRKGTVAVRINIKTNDLKTVLESDFWPKNVYAREWLSKVGWEKRSVNLASEAGTLIHAPS